MAPNVCRLQSGWARRQKQVQRLISLRQRRARQVSLCTTRMSASKGCKLQSKQKRRQQWVPYLVVPLQWWLHCIDPHHRVWAPTRVLPARRHRLHCVLDPHHRVWSPTRVLPARRHRLHCVLHCVLDPQHRVWSPTRVPAARRHKLHCVLDPHHRVWSPTRIPPARRHRSHRRQVDGDYRE